MTLVVYVAAPGGGHGVINAGGGTGFDVGAALLAGGGQFTVDDTVLPVLVDVLDHSGSVVRSGATPGPPVVYSGVGPVMAHSTNDPQVGDFLVRGADGVFFAEQVVPGGTGLTAANAAALAITIGA